MVVVLDMDETLIHSIFYCDIERQLRQEGGTEEDFYNYTKKLRKNASLFLQKSNHGNIAVFYRPGLHRFLYKLSEKCEVILWTAADRNYAKPILDHIDPNGDLLPYRLFREHCVKKGNVECAKDLELIGRDMSRVVLIDNSTIAAQTSPSNTYLIEDFLGDRNDKCLQQAWTILSEISELKDIRQTLEMMLDLHLSGINIHSSNGVNVKLNPKDLKIKRKKKRRINPRRFIVILLFIDSQQQQRKPLSGI